MNWLPSITVLLIFACLVAYEYIKDLRRDLTTIRKEAETAWRLYEKSNNELLALQGKHVPTESMFNDDGKPDDKPERRPPPFTGGIGPTAIRNRELHDRQQTEKTSEPRFASPATLNPDLADIKDAAKEATSNGRSN